MKGELTYTSAPVVAEQKAEWPRRVPLFGIHMDAVNMSEAISVLLDWTQNVGWDSCPDAYDVKLREGRQTSVISRELFDRPCRYVVTPNVDHVVMLRDHAGLRAAYADAGLVVADGWPVVAAARWLGQPLPERVAGSDLVPQLLDAARGNPPLRVYLLGAAPGVALRAAQNIHQRWPNVQVVGVDSPPLGFERSNECNDAIVSRIADAEPDLLVVGFGAPKQELWVHAHRERLRAKAAICAGATIDFLAGEKKRAPRWMRCVGMEWLHRLLTEPRRLARRYLRDAIIFPQLVWAEKRKL